MKTSIIKYVMLFATLSSYSTWAANSRVPQMNDTPNESNDTLPAKKAQVNTVVQDTSKVSADFKEMESDLDNLDQAQKKSDTTKIRIGKMKISVVDDGKDIVINKDDFDDSDFDDDWNGKDNDDFQFHKKKKNHRFEPHYAGFDIGLNTFLTANQSTTLPNDAKYLDLNTNKSFEVQANIAQLGINLIKDRIGIATGVGFKWNNYKFQNTNLVLYSDSTYLKYTFDNTTSYDKSKLTVWYLTVPVLLEFQIPVHNKPLYLSAGIEGGLKLGAHTKMVTTSGKKTKDRSDFHLNPYTYGLTARLGYDNFGVYGSYSLQTLFKTDEGPELYPFVLGVCFNF